MGCGSSVATIPSLPVGSEFKKRRSSNTSVGSFDSINVEVQASPLTKRYGHPSYFKADGYDIGLRTRVKGLFQSYFVGCARKTGEKVTIKEHHLTHYPGEENSLVALSEVAILNKLSNHTCYPRIHEMFLTDSSLFFVTEYIDSFRLINYMKLNEHKSSLALSDIKQISKALGSALQYCHQQKIVLRDLHPLNIMVTKTSNGGMNSFDIKIVDLSLAIYTKDNGLNNEPLCNHPCFDWNLVPFTAPEALFNLEYGASMDMWSLGVLIFCMISGSLPFEHRDDSALLTLIKNGHYHFIDAVWNTIPQAVKETLSQLIHTLPKDRITAKQFMKASWLNSF